MLKYPVLPSAFKAVHRIEVMDAKGNMSTAELEIKYHKMEVCPPIGKEKRYENLMLTVIHATERGTPEGRAPIEWKLITNLPVTSKAEAIEKLTGMRCDGRSKASIKYSRAAAGQRIPNCVPPSGSPI